MQSENSRGGKAIMLTEAEEAHLFQFIARHSKTPEHDRVVFLLSLKAGLRAAEIAMLDWNHVMDGRMQAIGEYIELPRKGTKGKNRARTVPVHPELHQALEAWMAIHPRVQAGVAITRSLRRANRYGDARHTANSLTLHMNRIYQDAGLVGASSHSGRRTAITKWSWAIESSGGSLSDVQRLAGHSSIAMTAEYIEGKKSAQHHMVNAA